MRSLLLVLAVLASPSPPRASDPPRVDVLAWFAMTPPQLGCWLERTWGHRDPKWSCALRDWKPSGDPCDDFVAYTEGPEFPQALAARVHPRLRAIRLDWEHGELRSVSLELDGRVPEATARRWFRLPARGAPESFERVDVEVCSSTSTCLTIERFEHLGAGEADCGDASEDATGAPRAD